LEDRVREQEEEKPKNIKKDEVLEKMEDKSPRTRGGKATKTKGQ
jgi:hypothetical protein